MDSGMESVSEGNGGDRKEDEQTRGCLRRERRRKQVFKEEEDGEALEDEDKLRGGISIRTPQDLEIFEQEDDEDSFYDSILNLDSLHSNVSGERESVPLYLQNPEDFSNDPYQRMRIKRAIITYRHHQEKKELIAKLTQQNKWLREHGERLKKQVVEMSSCECDQNASMDLSVLDVVIPEVRPKSVSSVVLSKKTSTSAVTPSLSKNRVGKTQTGSITERIGVSKGLVGARVQHESSLDTVKMSERTKNIPRRLDTSKSHKAVITTATDGKASAKDTALVPLSSLVQNEMHSLTAEAPKSRIVFAKKGSVPKALQALQSLQQQQQLDLDTINVLQQTNAKPPSELPAASQLIARSKEIQRLPVTFLNSSTNINTPIDPELKGAGQVLRTPSGQVLKLMQDPIDTQSDEDMVPGDSFGLSHRQRTIKGARRTRKSRIYEREWQ